MKAAAVPVGMSWMWTLAFEHHEDRKPLTATGPTREAAMAAFAKSWRREVTGHVGFWGAPEMRPTGEPIQRVLCPERSSGAFIGLAYRP
jgi:hypothetical protein